MRIVAIPLTRAETVTTGDNMTKLTDAVCRRALAKGGKLTKLSDGHGLQLWVHPSGVKSWHVAFRVAGAQKSKTIGNYPAVSLREARERASEARSTHEAAAPSKAKTFKEIKDDWRAQQARSGKSPATLGKLEWILTLAGELDAKPIDSIKAPDILAELRRLEEKGQAETAGRLRSTISRVFRFAAAQGLVEADPAALLKEAIAPPAVAHRAALVDRKGFAALMKAIDGYEGRGPIVRAGLMLLALTAARPGELRLATWTEVDLSAGVWTVPAGRMKMRQPHRAPLAPQSVALLESLRADSLARNQDTTFILPSERPGRPLSEAAFGTALRIMGFPASVHTPHGFRSSFSTIANESGLWNYDAVERALAHQDGSDVRRAYCRADWFEERRSLMNWWASQIDEMLALP
jgi:integrase